MTSIDQIEDHRERCQPYLLRLLMLARDDAATLTCQSLTEFIRATEAILAEAEAAGRDACAAAGPAGTFLSVRLSRLTAAADDLIAAAWAGDSAQLRRQLHRFDVLTSAIWTVQQSVYGPEPGRDRPLRPVG
jgi:hypothetical protein